MVYIMTSFLNLECAVRKSVIRCMCVIAALLCGSAVLSAAQPEVFAENRVLATVRDQVITVVDVMKKLDMIFYQQFPEYRNSPQARFEFYRANWRRVLEELVDRQLVLSWSEEKQFTVTNGDIREELEEIFGPDVMVNLYEAGLSLSEVREMLRADILLRRIISFYIRTPVLTTITPAVLKKTYAQRALETKGRELVLWRSISIKQAKTSCSREQAEQIHRWLFEDKLSFEEVKAKLPEGVEVISSQQFRSEKREMSPRVQEILRSLKPGVPSSLVSYEGREGQVWRIYLVDERTTAPMPSFSEMEGALRDELAAPQISKKTEEFFDDLRKQYHVKAIFSSEQLQALEPFKFYAEQPA